MAVVSREAPEDVAFGLEDGDEPDEARLIRATVRNIAVVNRNQPTEYHIETHPPEGDPDRPVGACPRQKSRTMAAPRSEIEKPIRERMARCVPPITFYD